MKYSKQLVMCLPSSSHINFLFDVIFVMFSIAAVMATSHEGNETDHEALLKIKSMITQDPYGALTSWNTSLHFCDWSGVTCGKRHRRVTRLRLDSLGLEGFLSAHVGNVSFLRVLNLTNNSFQGSIPHELGRLSRLRFLFLKQNEFNRIIPSNVSRCSKLEKLSLAYNKLVGSIPKEIGILSKLSFFDISYNNLTGGIPPFLGNLSSLQVFSIVKNPLGDRIPDNVGQWKILRVFYGGGCSLYGTIPFSLYNLSLLTDLSLAGNQLSGSLPPYIGAMFPHLVVLQLRTNQLTGLLPPSISNCSRLTYLEMSQNYFTGKLTIDFTKLKDISKIRLDGNLFGSKDTDEMKFIDSLENCSRLEELSLRDCMFQGVLPRSVGNLSNQLVVLDLTGNQLHGSLPLSIGNLVGLMTLKLGVNQFTGNIPSTIGKLQWLEVVYLYENQLSGPIPHAMGNLSLLILLDLYSNMLEGNIPSSLGNCHHLSELYLDDNKLKGKIPTQLLQLSSLSKVLDLSQNNISGSLPSEVGDLKMLSILDLSQNSLSGSIPSSLGDCASLSEMSLKGNSFQGGIPPSLGSLKGLVVLDLSQNNLSGQIPRFFERFSLEYLNLSFNDFEGEVPMLGVFANASAFSVVNNSRLCGGIVELGLSKCNETKKHNKKLHVFVIVILIASSLITIICLIYVWCKKKAKSQPSQSMTREQFMQLSYDQLLKATNGFSEDNLIGSGGFSSVYKGVLDTNNSLVAIKVLHLQNPGAQRSFMRECEAWRNIRHRNLLKIITSCSSIDFQGNDFKALVYEFMSKGSLHEWLHSSTTTSRLNLLQRINILIDIASALDYIHNHCQPSLVHGDLKPSNILLDDEMVAHVGDFGLARFLEETSYENSSTGIRGTIGYAAPEYGLGSEMTSKGDVYSFGILLLEVMVGKKPTDEAFNEDLSLHQFVSISLPDHLIDVIDVDILNAYQDDEIAMRNTKKIEESMASTIKIGLSCSVELPSKRMDIKTVLHELQQILNTLQHI